MHSSTASRYMFAVSDIFLCHNDEEEVFSVFNSIRNNGKLDVYDIAIKPIKYVSRTIVPLLTHIFHHAIKNGTFSKKIQVAKVTVLCKAGDKNDLRNSRSIYVLPLFSKGLGKNMHQRLYSFCEKFSILSI